MAGFNVYAQIAVMSCVLLRYPALSVLLVEEAFFNAQLCMFHDRQAIFHQSSV